MYKSHLLLTQPQRRLLSLDPVVNAKQTKCCFVVATLESRICSGSLLLQARFPPSLLLSCPSPAAVVVAAAAAAVTTTSPSLSSCGGAADQIRLVHGQEVKLCRLQWKPSNGKGIPPFRAQLLPIIAAISFHPVTSQVSKSLFVRHHNERILFWRRRCQPFGVAEVGGANSILRRVRELSPPSVCPHPPTRPVVAVYA